jgi:hypothetical protein
MDPHSTDREWNLEPEARDVLQRLLAEFGRDGFVPGWHHPSEEIEPSHYSWPWWEASRAVGEWRDALYEYGVVDPSADYLSEDVSQRMQQYGQSPSLLENVDLDTVRAVLTYVVRSERFSEGHMQTMFEAGVAQAATHRLVALGTAA